MKKIIRILFTSVLFLLCASMILTSCSGGGQTADTTDGGTSGETAKADETTEKKDETTMSDETTNAEETTQAEETTAEATEEEVWYIADNVEFYSKADVLIEEPQSGLDWSIFQYWKGYNDTDIYDSHGAGQYVKAEITCSAFEVWFGNNDQNTHTNVEIYVDGTLVMNYNMQEAPSQINCAGPIYVESGKHTIIVKGGEPKVSSDWNGMTYNIIRYSPNAQGEITQNYGYTFAATYPDGNTRAFTLGFDDGVSNDKKLIELCAKYGMRCCTFMLNSNNTANDVKLNVNGFDINVHFYGMSEIKEAYEGAEVAGHGASHCDLTALSDDKTKLIAETKGGNDALAEILGRDVVGFAYPYDLHDDTTVAVLKEQGILFARTCAGTNSGTLPTDFLLWNPTAINTEKNIPSIVSKCASNDSTELQCIYIWGHAGELDCGDGYSFDGATRWDDMEALLKQVSESGVFWAATNGEIATYVNAVRGLTYAEDGITNNSAVTVYGTLDGVKIEIGAGETYAIEKKEQPIEDESNNYGVVDSPLAVSDVGFKLTYPDGNTRAFTLSYDDGCTDDAKVIALCKKYGAKASFQMLSYWSGGSTVYDRDGYDITVSSLKAELVKSTYAGFEVGGHSASHPDLTTKTEEELYNEIEVSNSKISKLVGYTIRGFSYPGNGYNDTVIKHLMNAGIAYARTTNSTYGFNLPKNAYEFMKWNPTCCDQEANAVSLVTKCATNDVEELQCYYAWGHAFDLNKPDPNTKDGETGQRWDDLEAMLKAMKEAGNFWCATNIEVRDYIMATYKLYITEDAIENQSTETIYGIYNGKSVTIAAGATFELK